VAPLELQGKRLLAMAAIKENGGITYHCAGDKKPSRFVDLRIEDNHIRHVDRSGIFGSSTHWVRSKWYPSLGVVIRKNVLDDIGGDGIVNVATDGAVVESNVVAHANQRSQDFNVGIWPWSADNTVVQFNEVYGTRGQHDAEGFDSDWNSRNTVIQYNYSHDNEGELQPVLRIAGGRRSARSDIESDDGRLRARRCWQEYSLRVCAAKEFSRDRFWKEDRK
jgi:hypothetical protein